MSVGGRASGVVEAGAGGIRLSAWRQGPKKIVSGASVMVDVARGRKRETMVVAKSVGNGIEDAHRKGQPASRR